jgi:hypothetical protein
MVNCLSAEVAKAAMLEGVSMVEEEGMNGCGAEASQDR